MEMTELDWTFIFTISITSSIIFGSVALITIKVIKKELTFILTGVTLLSITFIGMSIMYMPEPGTNEWELRIENMTNIALTSRDCTELQELQLELIEDEKRNWNVIEEILKITEKRYEVLCK